MTKYLKIENKGALNIEFLSLMGGSTKSDDSTKIGVFGTGLKYAISYLLRTKNNFKLFVNYKEVVFTTKEKTIENNTFQQIYINGKHTSLTLNYGFQWKAWEAVREIWCNAIDAGEEINEITEEILSCNGKTTFYIEMTPDIQEVVDNWNSYFINETPLYRDDKKSIYLNNNEDKFLRIYKNNILILKSPYYKSLFNYDIKNAELNELREYKGSVGEVIAKSIIDSSKNVIDILLKEFKKYNLDRDKNIPFIEITTEYYPWYLNNKEKFVELFSGYVFVSPKSNNKCLSEKIIKVSDSLFNMLNKNGLSCEEIHKSSGGYYSSGSYSNDEDDYKVVINKSLCSRITEIANSLDIVRDFSIGVGLNSEFEFLINDNKITFSDDLDKLNYDDLESVYLLAVLQLDNRLHKVAKRMLKIIKQNKNFKEIISK